MHGADAMPPSGCCLTVPGFDQENLFFFSFSFLSVPFPSSFGFCLVYILSFVYSVSFLGFLPPLNYHFPVVVVSRLLVLSPPLAPCPCLCC